MYAARSCPWFALVINMLKPAHLILAAASCLLGVYEARAQAPLSTAFMYRGELATSGTPANGTYDIRFRLYDAASGGTQVGPTLCSDNLDVASGRFSLSLDFGSVFNAQQRYVEIEVREDSGLGCSDASGYTVLSPRQLLSSIPQATYAATATSAEIADTAQTATDASTLGGNPPAFYLNAANLTGALPTGGLSGIYSSPLTLSNPLNVFAGNGASLINLSATNISSGVLSAARMPTDWAAGGDLTGFYPNPTIGLGRVSLDRLAPNVQGVLSSLSRLTPAPTPRDIFASGPNANGSFAPVALPAGLSYTAIAVGDVHVVALRSDGVLITWGLNSLEQLNIPALPAGMTYTSVTAGMYHSFARRSDGSFVAWGWNVFGQLNIPALPAGITYTSIAGGRTHSLGLRSDGSMVAWGSNRGPGELSVPALPAGVTYTAAAAGESFSLGLRSDGTVVAWGNNSQGQLNVPALPAGTTYTAVAAGQNHGLALRSDGMIVGWGSNATSQLNIPALPAGVTYTAISASAYSSVALRSDGSVRQWGPSQTTLVPPAGSTYLAVGGTAYGDVFALRAATGNPSIATPDGLSIGTTTQPPAAGGLSVAGASSFAAGVTAASFSGSGTSLTNLNASNIASGTLAAARMPTDWAAGGDLTGTYPNPAIGAGTVNLNKFEPGLKSILSRLSTVPGGPPIPADAIGWGQNPNGQSTVPALPSGLTYSAVAPGGNHSLALRSDGTIAAWGENSQGELNIPALPSGMTYNGVAAGFFHSYALRSDGTIQASGYNGYNQLAVPSLPAGVTYTAVASGGYSGFAIRSNGTAVGWGSNIAGETNVPAPPAGLTYTAIAGGYVHAAGLLSNGTVIAWGRSSEGQTTVPALPGGVTYTAISAGNFHCVALRSNGTVVAWGQNTLGECNVPALPAGMTYTSISAGDAHSVALRSDGTVVAWGDSGDNLRAVPTLPAGYRYTKVVTRARHTLALRDGPGPLVGSSIGLSITGPSTFSSTLTAASFIGSSASITDLTSTTISTSRLTVRNGVIQLGATPVTGTNDLGLYSALGSIRFVTNNAQFAWYTDGGTSGGNAGAGTTPRMTLSATGNLAVTGSLSKGGGSFKIDHPLDPTNKFLYHSFVESPDMMNIYNGVVITGPDGTATVTLPDYFEALNRDFRYQLTVIDESSFALVRVSRRIEGNTFEITSSTPNVEVSWEVTGVRKDAWAERNRIPNTVDKVGAEKGTYLHPEAFQKATSPSGSAD